MNTIFLPKGIQEALEAILESGKFYHCDEKRKEGDISLGFLTNEEKALYTLYAQESIKFNKLINEYEKSVKAEEIKEKERELDLLEKHVQFLTNLFCKCVQETYPDKELDIRENWEIVEITEEEARSQLGIE